MSRIKEIGWPVAPITDRASTFGWVRWEALAKKNDLRPVFGVELAVAESIHEKKPTVDYWTFIAIDEVAPINRLVELATEQFRYQPLLTYAQAMAAEGVYRVVGHRAKLELVEPSPTTVYGLCGASAKGHVKRAIASGLRMVAATENFYPRIEDEGLYEVLCGRGASTQTYQQHIQSDAEWLEEVGRKSVLGEAELKAALSLRNDIWGQCKAGLRSAEIVHPPHPKPLREMCIDGAARIGCDLSRPEYAARMDLELELIAAKNFEDYFYLVADLCQWARKEMAVGPARGSSCGSLVCYLLEITTVDPIPFGLIFERFIDLNRSDLPDVDIDFSDQQRHRVFDYLRKTYGIDRVARLGTVAMFKARSSLQEAGAALKIPRWKCDAVAESLIERSGADSRATDTLIDTLMQTVPGKELLAEYPEAVIAGQMEGHPRHYSQHAAGVVVASEPISNYVAIDHRTNATMCDKIDAEGRLGLLKIDALGLTQLSVFEDAVYAAGMTMQDLQRVPLDDEASFAVLNRGEFSGIFQWNGNALQSLTRQVVVDRFNDIVAISALARPGPLATGGATQWANRRMSGTIPPGIHPMLDSLTSDTYGVVIYQEQVMRIVREMGGLSWADTSSVRKGMSKSLGNEFFEQFKKKFVDGSGPNGVPEEKAVEIWDQINTFGSWAFNKSHAVAYGYISYWCCWLKANHPFEFAAATLTHESDPARQIELLREMRNEGYDYLPVDADLSTDKWTAGSKDGKKVLVGPLQNVKGIGPKLVSQIIGARSRGEPMPERAKKLLADPKTDIDSLSPVSDAFKRVMPDPSERNINTPPTPIGKLKPSKEPYEAMVFCTPIKINPRDENEIINVQKRGHEITDGRTDFLQVRLSDDSGTIMGKVNRFNFKNLGPEIINKGRVGKSLWAFKGKIYTVGDNFLVFSITQSRYIGDVEE
jgi:DNA polymerase III alpha subunit